MLFTQIVLLQYNSLFNFHWIFLWNQVTRYLFERNAGNKVQSTLFLIWYWLWRWVSKGIREEFEVFTMFQQRSPSYETIQWKPELFLHWKFSWVWHDNNFKLDNCTSCFAKKFFRSVVLPTQAAFSFDGKIRSHFSVIYIRVWHMRYKDPIKSSAKAGSNSRYSDSLSSFC